MDHATFEKVFEAQVDACRRVLVEKAREYATDDRLHNFRVAATLMGTTPAAALSGFMAKHMVSIYDLIRAEANGETVTMAMWDEKIGDALNYLFLLKAVVEEPHIAVDAFVSRYPDPRPFNKENQNPTEHSKENINGNPV